MMRTRPPDLTDREVATSNTTLNTFLGGKQKSWMMGIPGAAKGTTRPATNPRLQSSAFVFPSPAPSEEPSPEQTHKSPVNENFVTTTQPDQIAPFSDIPTLNRPPVLHSSALESLSELQGNHSIDQQTEPQRVAPFINGNLNGLEVHGTPEAGVFNPVPQYAPKLPPPNHDLRQSRQSLAQPGLPLHAFHTVSNPGPIVSDQVNPVPLSRPRGRPPKRPRLQLDHFPSESVHSPTEPSKAPSLRPRIHVIDDYIRRSGGVGNLNSTLERPRFMLLRDACNNEDVFYVVLHQMFCLWSIDKNRLHQMNSLAALGFGSVTKITSAFHIMGQLIKENDLIAPHHLKWLSEFPSPIDTLLSTSTLYRQSVSQVCGFLTNLTHNWQTLKQLCASRHYPPLVDEMVGRLGLLSPVLHGVFFTATRRNLGIVDDSIGAQMEKLFVQDRDGHRELASRYNTAYPPTEQEVRDRNATLVQLYLQLYMARTKRDSVQSNKGQFAPAHNNSRTPVIANPLQLPPGSQGNSISTQNGSSNLDYTMQSQIPSYVQDSSMQHHAGAMAMQSPQATLQNPSYNNPRPSPTLSTGQPSPLQPQHQFEGRVLGSNYSSFHQDYAIPVADSGATIYARQEQTTQMVPTQTPIDVAAQQLSNDQSNYQHNSQQQASRQQSFRSPSNASQGLYRPQQQAHISHATGMAPHRVFQGHNTVQSHANQQQAMYGMRGNMNAVHANPPELRNPTPTAGRSPNLSSNASAHTFSNPAPVSNLPTHSPRISPFPGVRAVAPYRSQQIKIPDRTLLIPQQGVTIAPHAPNPDMTALHQSNLRSPILMTKGLSTTRRYYQAVRNCALGPVLLPRDLMLSTHEFKVSEFMFRHMAKDSITGPETPVSRELQQGSLQFRLRCVRLRQPVPFNMAEWVVADTYWPPSMFMEVNGSPIEVRRKNLHVKDLPVDITASVVSTGANNMNKIRISLSRPGKSHNEYYGFAVEVIEVLQHHQVVDMCLKHQRIPAEQTLNNIKKSLSSLDDDDEISMIISDLTIDLTDPFQAKIFDIPVRGNSCLHRECFDLETFLNTRTSKPKRPNQPSMVDIWKCPLCGRDARPYSLLVDDFLVSVRKELEDRELLDTKAIIISADGTWVPKVEPLPQKRTSSKAGFDDSDDESEIEAQIKAAMAVHVRATSVKKKEVEIIDLDDD